MHAHANLDEQIVPGQCFALVTTRQRAFEDHGVRLPDEFLLVLGNVLAQERMVVPVNLAYLVGMLRIAKPLRLDLDVGQREDFEAIRALLPPDPPLDESVDDLVRAVNESKALIERAKGV